MSAKAVAPIDVSKLSFEEVFEQYKKLPDWDRFPMPEVFYEKYNVKKPQPASIQESVSMNPFMMAIAGGPIEKREPAPGGVREIKDYMTLPVEVKRLNEETGELEDMPPVEAKPIGDMDALKQFQIESIQRQPQYSTKFDMESLKNLIKAQTAADTTQCSTTDSSSSPTKDNTTETQLE